jgi:hypothetical protein
MHAIWLLALILFIPNLSMAGEKGKLVSLLADYADLRERVQEVRETRKSGYASDTNSLTALFKEISEAKQAAFNFRAAIHKAESAGNNTHVTTSYIIYAFEAMHEIIKAEIEHNLYLPNSDVPLRLAAKYEEAWKIIDPYIPVVPAP